MVRATTLILILIGGIGASATANAQTFSAFDPKDSKLIVSVEELRGVTPTTAVRRPEGPRPGSGSGSVSVGVDFLLFDVQTLRAIRIWLLGLVPYVYLGKC